MPPARDFPALEAVLPPDVALNVRNRVSETLGVAADSLEIESLELREWPNRCLGLPAADEACAEVLTPGWLLVFHVNGQAYRFHVDETGMVIRQEP